MDERIGGGVMGVVMRTPSCFVGSLHFKPKRGHSSGFRRADVLYYSYLEIAILRLHSDSNHPPTNSVRPIPNSGLTHGGTRPGYLDVMHW